MRKGFLVLSALLCSITPCAAQQPRETSITSVRLDGAGYWTVTREAIVVMTDNEVGRNRPPCTPSPRDGSTGVLAPCEPPQSIRTTLSRASEDRGVLSDILSPPRNSAAFPN